MCEFCKKIIYTDEEYFNARVKGGDFIYKDHNGYGILIDTGDSGCLGSLDVDYCPKCGRKLSGAGNNNCNLNTCRYNADGKCTNEEKRKECVEVSKLVLCLESEDD